LVDVAAAKGPLRPILSFRNQRNPYNWTADHEMAFEAVKSALLGAGTPNSGQFLPIAGNIPIGRCIPEKWDGVSPPTKTRCALVAHWCRFPLVHRHRIPLRDHGTRMGSGRAETAMQKRPLYLDRPPQNQWSDSIQCSIEISLNGPKTAH
jgi:hypothetical protein